MLFALGCLALAEGLTQIITTERWWYAASCVLSAIVLYAIGWMLLGFAGRRTT